MEGGPFTLGKKLNPVINIRLAVLCGSNKFYPGWGWCSIISEIHDSMRMFVYY